MTMEQFTRCPGCRTVFRVTPAQLALREGQVRCGHCRTVFNGTENLMELARSPAFPTDDDAATGPLTVTLRNAHALEPVGNAAPAAAPGAAAAAPAAAVAASTPAVAKAAPAPRRDEDEEVDYDHRFAWDRPKKRSPRRTALYAVAALVLVLALAGQLVAHYRDAVAAHWPASRPLLARACAMAGCEVRPLRDIAGLSIDASDLQADPAQRGLLVLSATIRNRATYAVAIPYLELTLTDGKDNVVVRRALAPSEYAPSADAAAGIPGNGEVAVRLHFDASATTQSGYRVYLFYP
jgi:predicted Zn finger-like uncharacterized protein